LVVGFFFVEVGGDVFHGWCDFLGDFDPSSSLVEAYRSHFSFDPLVAELLISVDDIRRIARDAFSADIHRLTGTLFLYFLFRRSKLKY
jgi:hypothetical protein